MCDISRPTKNDKTHEKMIKRRARMIKRTYPYVWIYPLYFLLCGGNVEESNPPNPLTDIGHRIGYIDFEDQEGHQTSTAPLYFTFAHH